MFGLIAVDDDGRDIGLANCGRAPRRTWCLQPTCYLEEPSGRRPPAGGTNARGAPCWHAAKGAATFSRGGPGSLAHPAVQRPGPLSLYDQVGRAASFVVYEM